MSIDYENGQYAWFERMLARYHQLQDEMSKRIFWARLQFEANPDIDRVFQLCKEGYSVNHSAVKSEGFKESNSWKAELAAATANGKRLVLYGAGGYGQECAKILQTSHINFYAFCDKEKKGSIVCGKPVLSPEELFACPESYAVAITALAAREEISNTLQENGFDKASIFYHFVTAVRENQYFEFPELYRQGQAFVDAGSYDGADTLKFIEWAGGNYSKIYLFEPDKRNYNHCKSVIRSQNIKNVEMFQAGLSDHTGESHFAAASNAGSYLLSSQKDGSITRPDTERAVIPIYRLDDVVDTTIGMIKMDIEGAEFDALHGAAMTIQRDKPLLAVCIYHRQGDMLAIMDYLHILVPEYRFWLRHYGPSGTDTVLYGAL